LAKAADAQQIMQQLRRHRAGFCSCRNGKPYFRVVIVTAPWLTVTAILLAIEAVHGKIR
jgi:hypothetical protein